MGHVPLRDVDGDRCPDVRTVARPALHRGWVVLYGAARGESSKLPGEAVKPNFVHETFLGWVREGDS